MKIPYQRINVANINIIGNDTIINKHEPYAYYENWKFCVIDYGFWQNRIAQKAKSDIEYLDLIIEKNFAEDPVYKEKILSIAKQIQIK